MEFNPGNVAGKHVTCNITSSALIYTSFLKLRTFVVDHDAYSFLGGGGGTKVGEHLLRSCVHQYVSGVIRLILLGYLRARYCFSLELKEVRCVACMLRMSRVYGART